MKVGQIVYHVNCGTERFRIRKRCDIVATLDRLDLPMTRKINGEMGYQTAICSIENLRESLEDNSSQLSLF